MIFFRLVEVKGPFLAATPFTLRDKNFSQNQFDSLIFCLRKISQDSKIFFWGINKFLLLEKNRVFYNIHICIKCRQHKQNYL
jgi:hypothetical protein